MQKKIHPQGCQQIKHHLNFSLFPCCGFDGTYRVGRAGVSRAAWVGWRGGSGPNCSASCSSCRRTPELWPLCCWTMVAPLSQWWATGAGSWLSSDCAKAWFGSAWLWGTHRGRGRLNKVKTPHPACIVHLLCSHSCPCCEAELKMGIIAQNLDTSSNCLQGCSDNRSHKNWHHLSCIRLLHFVASLF